MKLTIKGILSYPNIITPRAIQQGDTPKYSCSILIRKGDPQIDEINRAIETAKLDGFPSGFPNTARVFLKESPEYPEFFVISTSANEVYKPDVVDSNLQPIIDPSSVYAGVIAYVSINTFSYNKPASKGVSAGLNGVMLTGIEGELGRLDGRPTVEMMFGDVATPKPSMFS